MRRETWPGRAAVADPGHLRMRGATFAHDFCSRRFAPFRHRAAVRSSSGRSLHL